MPASARITFLGPADMADEVRQWLPTGTTVRVAGTDTEFDALLPDSDVILDASMRLRFPASRVERATALKAYVTATTGADHIDAEALRRRGIPLLTLRGRSDVLKNVTAAAEHSWLLLLACARGLRPAIDGVLHGSWDRSRHPGTMLRGRVLGLVGCGRIGQWMARYAAAFEMRRIGYDPHLEAWPSSIERATLDEVMRNSDFVSVHVPLTDETRGLVAGPQLALTRPGVVIINTSRGEVIDEDALLAGLRSGHVGAAGLDVVSGEPDVSSHPLVEYARENGNLIITPHIGGFSPDAVRYVLKFSCERISELLTTGCTA